MFYLRNTVLKYLKLFPLHLKKHTPKRLCKDPSNVLDSFLKMTLQEYAKLLWEVFNETTQTNNLRKNCSFISHLQQHRRALSRLHYPPLIKYILHSRLPSVQLIKLAGPFLLYNLSVIILILSLHQLLSPQCITAQERSFEIRCYLSQLGSCSADAGGGWRGAEGTKRKRTLLFCCGGS